MFRCLIATLGKDAPGVNAVIRAATRVACQIRGWTVCGARRGMQGVIERDFHSLGEQQVRFILGKGGSMLGSVDRPIPMDGSEDIARIAQSLRDFDIVIAMGGVGSYSVLNEVYRTHDLGVTTTLFIPASIENEFLHPEGPDAGVSAEAVGADTAANTAVRAIDRLREQSYQHRTVFLVQCVGYKSNYLPLAIGLGSGAHRIYLPDYPPISGEVLEEMQTLFGPRYHPHRIDLTELVEWIRHMFDKLRKTYLLVIVPHGLRAVQFKDAPPEAYEALVRSQTPPDFSILRLLDEVRIKFHDTPTIQTRYVVLDDLQRGGPPTVRDRLLGTLYGEAAVEEFVTLVKGGDTAHRGHLNLLAIDSTSRHRWRCYTREEVEPLIAGERAGSGGLDTLAFMRLRQGIMSGYQPEPKA